MVDAVASTLNPFQSIIENGKKSVETTTGTNQALSSLSADFDGFLKLFLAQLQNQDPTSPMDPNEMASQLAQFSTVEQGVKMNAKLEELINQNQASQVGSASTFIGSTVEFEGNKVELKNGTADFNYKIDPGATKATVTIKDSLGVTVYKSDVESSAGEHPITWPGITTEGERVKDGIYTVQVFQSINGSDKASTTTVSSSVDSVKTKDGVITLILANGDKIASSDALSIKQSQISQVTAASALVGTSIKAEGSNVVLKDGEAEFNYIIGKDMIGATLTIKDNKGAVVYSKPVDHAQGDHLFEWDGKNNSGNTVKDGVYRVEVIQTNPDKTSGAAPIIINGVVVAAKLSGGSVILLLDNGESVDAANALSIGAKVTG